MTDNTGPNSDASVSISFDDSGNISLAESGTAGWANSKRAGIGGVGGGTGVVAIAQAIGAKTAVGAVLLYLSPSISIAAGALLYYALLQAANFQDRRALNDARSTFDQIMRNPRLSTEFKARMQAQWESLEESVANSKFQRAKLTTRVRSTSSTG